MRRTSWIDQRINDGVAMLVWSTSHVHEVLNLLCSTHKRIAAHRRRLDRYCNQPRIHSRQVAGRECADSPIPPPPFDKDIRKAVADWHFSEVQQCLSNVGNAAPKLTSTSTSELMGFTL